MKSFRFIRSELSIDEFIGEGSKHYSFELGEMYINQENVVFSLNKDHYDLFDNAKKMINGLKYKSDSMEAEISKYLPAVVLDFETETELVMIVKKPPDLILLKDVLAYFGGRLDPKHTAWILSSIYNILCYFKLEDIIHNDISLNTYFISPKFHSGAILGGWWYSSKTGAKLVAVPGRTYNLLPSDIKSSKISDSRVDLDLLRAVGRELLGDPTGANIAAPEAMKVWLMGASSGDSFGEYSTWGSTVINESFGGRFFTDMELDPNKI